MQPLLLLLTQHLALAVMLSMLWQLLQGTVAGYRPLHVHL
jgi:hypothetical protein